MNPGGLHGTGGDWQHGREQQDLHSVGHGDVELYIRTYNTLLRSSGEIRVKALEEVHLNTNSSLHPSGREAAPDMSAFIYAVWRLPACMIAVAHVVMGQSQAAFRRGGLPDVEEWQSVAAPGRRRHWRYDGADCLAVYIGSSSDVDDLVPTLTAYQIEWNKLHTLLHADPSTLEAVDALAQGAPCDEATATMLRERLLISSGDWDRLAGIWEGRFWSALGTIGAARKAMTVRLLDGSHVGYVRATRTWWTPIDAAIRALDLNSRPVYFVSSNRHSLVNPLSGFALRRREALIDEVSRTRHHVLYPAFEHLSAHGGGSGGWENFLYYASKELHGRAGEQGIWAARTREEEERGIHFVRSTTALDVDAQIVEVARLCPADLDPRLAMPGLDALRASPAIVVNIDYPLGMQAYHILRRVVESVVDLRAVYVLGKAATLNGRIGDVMIADAVHDEHSANTFWLRNAFRAADIAPYLRYGSVLDNQKAVAVKGTFLQNRQYLDFYYRESYTVVEMEAGPYLDALYEYTYPTRYPAGENINFQRLPLEVGLLHYASDTPYTRGRNLGAHTLSYYGMDSTYAASIAILRRILTRESSQRAEG
jgi:hypothetical protein